MVYQIIKLILAKNNSAKKKNKKNFKLGSVQWYLHLQIFTDSSTSPTKGLHMKAQHQEWAAQNKDMR